MKSVVINVYGDRRIVITQTGGYDLEALVDGIGWVLDNDADIPDHVIEAHLKSAIKALQQAASPGGMMKYAWKEAVKQANS